MCQAASEASTCVRREPFASDSVNSPFFVRHGMVLYDYYAKHRAKAARFASAMAGVTQSKWPPMKAHASWEIFRNLKSDSGS